MRIRWKQIVWAGVALIALPYTAACLACAGVLATNTLVNNGQWVSTKEGLEVKVMEASAFMRRPQSLAGGCLNLDAWQGFQEVLVRDKMKLNDAEFDFELAQGAYLAFLLEDGGTRAGYRISANPALKSVYFVSDDAGEFSEQRELALPSIPYGQWNHFHFHFDGTSATIEINGQAVNAGPMRMPMFARPGFRGSLRHAAVDNAVFRQDHSVVLNDNFLNADGFQGYFLAALLTLLLILVGAQYCQSLSGIPLGQSLNAVAGTSLFLAMMATLAPLYVRYSVSSYPTQASFARLEFRYLSNHWNWRSEEIVAQARSSESASDNLVLFVGSSQTFGAGAATERDTYVSVLQRKLDGNGVSPRFHCVNAGVNGTGTPTLAPFYCGEWVNLHPRLVVIDLGINDRFNSDAEYAANLESIIALNQEQKIPTLLVLEPYSWEWDEETGRGTNGELHSHAAMRQVAAKYGIAIVDVNACLNGGRDRGFLWWDFVHPTSFGHRLIAECVYPEVARLLGNPR